ncbi:MAG: OB-fold-containig protein [Pikeienuella sp.]
MLDFLLAPEMAPFSFAFLLVIGLVVLELVFLLLGGSLIGMDADGPELDLEAEFDFDGEVGAEPELNSEIDGAVPSGPLAWLGLGEAPFVLWLAGVATSFGIAGYCAQLMSNAMFGGMIPAVIIAPLAIVPGIIGGKIIARAIAAMAPKTESSAISRQFLGGRIGVITQGTASKGRPAEARIVDRYGNPQYLRVEPREDGVTIPQGTDVIIFRPVGDIYPVIPFGDD